MGIPGYSDKSGTKNLNIYREGLIPIAALCWGRMRIPGCLPGFGWPSFSKEFKRLRSN